jgi:hypothetical protein
MRNLLAVVSVLVMVTTVGADDMRPRHRGDVGTDLFVEVPLDYDTGVVFPFGGSHHAVPGVVTINKAPYLCRPHNLTFRERTAFVEHLGVKHGLSDREIPGMVLVEHNQVRYVGD